MKNKWTEKGQSLVEFALVLPVLLLVLAGVLDLGRLFYTYVAVTDAAGEGAAYGAINPEDTDGIIARITDSSGGLVGIEADMVTVESPTIATGQPITVTVSFTFTLATPIINGIVPGGEIPLRGVATEVILAGWE